MNKFLIVATVPSMIGQFNMNNIQLLLDLGYEVHVACNYYDRSVWNEKRVSTFMNELSKLHIKKIQIQFSRTPYNLIKMIKSFLELRKYIKKEKYIGLHCHTPVAGFVSRIAVLGTNTKLIYTAHGFHFFKGAPLKNWLLYYPIEVICSYLTNILITINKEDYYLARMKLRAKKIFYIPGVGIDVKKFNNIPENI